MALSLSCRLSLEVTCGPLVGLFNNKDGFALCLHKVSPLSADCPGDLQLHKCPGVAKQEQGVILSTRQAMRDDDQSAEITSESEQQN